MQKLTLPDEGDCHRTLVHHLRGLRVVASFSRALTEGLRADKSLVEFDATRAAAVQWIGVASGAQSAAVRAAT